MEMFVQWISFRGTPGIFFSPRNFEGMGIGIPAECVPIRSHRKGTGIVIPITQTKLWEREGNRES